MASKLCDSCKSATAALFCRADSAFLCLTCDSRIHAAAANNRLASSASRRHARVWVCEVCEQAPAHVTCKADAAALCAACDRDIHTANPLARRHDRVPVTPFYDTPKQQHHNSILGDRCFDGGDADVSREEAEAASWLLPNPPNKVVEVTGQFLFPEMMDPYLDMDYGLLDPKVEAQEQNSSVADGVVPVQSKTTLLAPPLLNGDRCFELDFSGSKSFPYTPYAASAAAQSLSHSATVSHQLSSPSLEAGVVPDGSDMSNPYSRSGGGGTESNNQPVQQLSAVDREARVLRYREKRKNRKFEKTIRYASRKAYAETRPRVKGRFAKRTEPEIDVEVDERHHHLQQHHHRSLYTGFGVVPSF